MIIFYDELGCVGRFTNASGKKSEFVSPNSSINFRKLGGTCPSALPALLYRDEQQ
jgi:hypothetical protein